MNIGLNKVIFIYFHLIVLHQSVLLPVMSNMLKTQKTSPVLVRRAERSLRVHRRHKVAPGLLTSKMDEWALIRHVQQPTLVTLQTYNDSCEAHRIPAGVFWIEVMIGQITEKLEGKKKSKTLYQCLSSRLCPCLSPLFHENNGSMEEKTEWERGRGSRKEGDMLFWLAVLWLPVAPLSLRCGSSSQSLYVSLS